MDAPTSSSPVYKALGGRSAADFGFALKTMQRLYLADDHVLQVANNGYTESYRRFFFKDIQALVMSESSRRRNLNILLALFSAGAALFTWVIADGTSPTVGYWLGGALLGVLGVAFGFNLGRGKTCVCTVKTAVQTEVLWSLNREPAATKIFAELKARIANAQGTLSTELVASTGGVGVSASASPQPLRSEGASGPRRVDDGRWHQYLFYSMLMAAAVLAADAILTSFVLTVGSFLTSFLSMGLLVMALIRQRDADTSPALRRLVWGVLGFVLSLMVLTYVCFIAMIFKNTESYQGQTDWITTVAAMSLQDSVFLAITYLFAVIGNLVIAVVGFVAVQAHRRGQASSNPTVGPP